MELNGGVPRLLHPHEATTATLLTPEGLPETAQARLGMAFVNRGAVQCGLPVSSCGPIMQPIQPHLKKSPRLGPLASVLKCTGCRACGRHPRCRNITSVTSEPDDNPRSGSAGPDGGYERAVGTAFRHRHDAPGMAHGAISSAASRGLRKAIHTDEDHAQSSAS